MGEALKNSFSNIFKGRRNDSSDNASSSNSDSDSDQSHQRRRRRRGQDTDIEQGMSRDDVERRSVRMSSLRRRSRTPSSGEGERDNRSKSTSDLHRQPAKSALRKSSRKKDKQRGARKSVTYEHPIVRNDPYESDISVTEARVRQRFDQVLQDPSFRAQLRAEVHGPPPTEATGPVVAQPTAVMYPNVDEISVPPVASRLTHVRSDTIQPL